MIRAGFILLVMGFLISAGWAESQSTTAPAKAVSGQAQHYRQAYREGFQPPNEATDEVLRMRELIEKINRTALPDYQPEAITHQPRVTPKSPVPAATAATLPATSPEVLSTQTLKELAQRVPDSVADPICLGDALYRSGHCTQALFIYQNAMEEAKDPEDQVWLFYQMGCCLKDAKPAEARKYFQKVRTTAPDSSWAELASIQLQLVDWTERNQPTQFLEDLHRDLQPQDERIEASRQAQPRTGGKDQPTGSGALGSPDEVAATPGMEEKATSAPAETITAEPTMVSKTVNEQ